MSVLFVVMFLVMLSFGIVMPTLPFLAKEMHASSVQMSFLITGWAMMQVVTTPVWGPLSDRIGRKLILVVGLIGNALSFLLLAVATTYNVLLIARIVGGMLSAATIPTAHALAADLSTSEQRTGAISLLGVAFSGGFLLGPAIGGGLAVLDPRGPFWTAGFASFLIALFALVKIHDVDGRPRTHIRPIYLRHMLASVWGHDSVLYWLSLAGTLTISSLIAMMAYFFIDRLESQEIQVGLAFTAMGIGAVVTQSTIGWLSRRWGETVILIWALLVSALGFLMLAVSWTFAMAFTAVSLTGAGTAMLRPPIVSLVSQRSGMMHGTAMGLLFGFDAMGRTIGPLSAGYLYSYEPMLPFITAAGVCALFASITYRWVKTVGIGPPDLASRPAPTSLAAHDAPTREV